MGRRAAGNMPCVSTRRVSRPINVDQSTYTVSLVSNDNSFEDEGCKRGNRGLDLFLPRNVCPTPDCPGPEPSATLDLMTWLMAGWVHWLVHWLGAWLGGSGQVGARSGWVPGAAGLLVSGLGSRCPGALVPGSGCRV